MQNPRGLCLQGGPQSRRRPWPGTLLAPAPTAWDLCAPEASARPARGSQYAGSLPPTPSSGTQTPVSLWDWAARAAPACSFRPDGLGVLPCARLCSIGARSPGALCGEPVGTVVAQCPKVSDTWSYFSFIILNQVSLSDRPEVLGTGDGPQHLHSPANTAGYKDDDFSPQN